MTPEDLAELLEDAAATAACQRTREQECVTIARLRSRPLASLYVAGPFAMGYTEFYNFLIPLYGLSLGMSAGAIGMLVGARSLLAVFLSIHVGVLMDRFGTRRVTLFFVWTAITSGASLPAAAVVLAIAAAADR